MKKWMDGDDSNDENVDLLFLFPIFQVFGVSVFFCNTLKTKKL
jgi:hypothetical protein